MSCPVVYFQDPQTKQLKWQCPNRMGLPTIHPATTKRCWRHNCKGIPPPPSKMFCANVKCSNIKKNHPDALYCSSKCASAERTRRWRASKKST